MLEIKVRIKCDQAGCSNELELYIPIIFFYGESTTRPLKMVYNSYYVEKGWTDERFNNNYYGDFAKYFWCPEHSKKKIICTI